MANFKRLSRYDTKEIEVTRDGKRVTTTARPYSR